MRNDRGMSLIEVMICLGILTIAMMGFMTLVNSQSKATTYLEDKLSRVSLETEINLWFSKPDYCNNLLKGISAPLKNGRIDIQSMLTQPAQVTALRDVFPKSQNKNIYDQLEVNKISLEDSTVPGPTSSGTLNIVYYPQRLRKGGGPPSLTPIKIKTAVQVDANSKIVSCQPEDGTGQGCLAADWKKRIPSSIDLSAACGKTHYPGVPLASVSMEIAMKDGSTKSFDLMTDIPPKVPAGEVVWGNIVWSKTYKMHHAWFGSGYSTLQYNMPYLAQCMNGKWIYPSIDEPSQTVVIYSSASSGIPLPNAGLNKVVKAIKYQTGGEPRTPKGGPCDTGGGGGQHDSGGPGGSSGTGAGY